LLAFLERGMETAGPMSVEGCVAIGVRGSTHETWLVAELGSEPKAERTSTLDRDADAILLLSESCALEVIEGSGTVPRGAQASGDRELLVSFVSHCLAARSQLDLRGSRGGKRTRKKRTRRDS
jgi:hypothetical protein